MNSKDREHALREQLALISTEVYLLMRSDNQEERIDRYNTVQDTISTIINIMDNQAQNPHLSCPDVMFQ